MFEKKLKLFRFWCQKILPIVYDDSLSYYEVLCKVVEKLNEVIINLNTIPDYIDEQIKERLSDEHLMEIMEEFIEHVEAAISSNNEGDNTNSSKDYKVGQLVWWNGALYKVIRDIDAGDTFIVNTNIELFDFETAFNNFTEQIKYTITENDDFGNTIASVNRDTGSWLWLNDKLYKVVRDITEGTAYIFTGENVNVVPITIEEESEMIYYPRDKKLSLHAKVSDYSEIVTRGDYHIYNPNKQAIEIRKVE